mgnify:CR=1 FL=1
MFDYKHPLGNYKISIVKFFAKTFSNIGLFFLSFLIAKPSSLVIGMSETMGIFGMINANYYIDEWSDSKNHYFITVGTFPIPLMGGAGIGWKRYFNSSRITPFTSATMSGTYILGWCQTDNCDNAAKLGIILTGALGYDFHFIQSNRLNMHLQLGVLSQYDLANQGFFESPSDKPSIWPAINIKFGS